MKHWRDYIILVILAGPIIALDQWTKALVRNNLAVGETWLPLGWEWIYAYFHVVHWYNMGAAFGMFQQGWMVFTALAFLVIGLIIFYYPSIPAADWSLRLALGLQLGGATGNLLDRLQFSGRVTDFVRVGDFPIFNVADSSISVGVAVLVLGMWITDKQNKKKQLAQGATVSDLNILEEAKDVKDE